MPRSRTIRSRDLARLVDAACAVRVRAYAPYSRFKVGAAVLGASGRAYAACNVENSSFGLSLCAERAAVAAAVAGGEERIAAVAVATPGREPSPPCGMCRQVLIELGGPSVPVRLRAASGRERTFRLGQLLPRPFGPRFL